MSTASKWRLWLRFNMAEKCCCLEEHEQTPESWATYSERVVGGSGGSSSGPCWRRQHGQSCWKDAKCAEVQPRDQIGLLLGIKMEKKLRGGDLRGPACLGQPPSLVWMAPVPPHQLRPGPADLFLTLLQGRALQTSTWLWHSFKASLLPWECLHVLTQQARLFLGTQATSPASLLLTPYLHSAQSCASLSPLDPRTHCLPCKKCASLPPHLATSYSSCGFHLSLGVPSSRKPSFTPKASAQLPFLCSPNMPTFPYNSMHHMVSEWPV